MDKKERKIIFECRVGSHLYGTNRPDSDEDFMGIFLPSTEDALGTNDYSLEWPFNIKVSDGPRNAKGDVDRKYFSIKQFCRLLLAGDSKPLEMLFSPESVWVSHTPEWLEIVKIRDVLVSKKSISPIVGFAITQAKLSSVKGENLNTLTDLIELFSKLPQGKKIDYALTTDQDSGVKFHKLVKVKKLEDGVEGFEVAGKKFLMALKVSDLIKALTKLKDRYGTRSKAAAAKGIDLKALSHAYRLVFQLETLLRTNKLQLPLPPHEVEFLKEVRAGNYIIDDYFADIDQRLAIAKAINTKLKETVDKSVVDDLCIRLTYNHLCSK